MKFMNRDRWKKPLAYLLLASGTVLLFLGTRTLLEAHFGQSAAARQFRSAASPAVSLPSRRPLRGATMAKLMIPRLATQLYVIEGDGPRELRRGPGHLADSAMPGSRGNCVIAGHRDTHFRALKDVRKGDDILVQTDDGSFLYRVNRTSVVPPSDTRSLQPTRDAVLNLITCYPFYYAGAAPKRFVVEATLAGEVSPGKISRIRNAR
jgi:sortase A